MTPPTLTCPPERRWTCQLAEDWTIRLPRFVGRVSAPYRFRVKKAGRLCDSTELAEVREWLVLNPDGRLTIRADYATDGCSLVPDFARALPGCVLHDALRQATTLDPACPWTRAEADIIFRETMRAFGFNWFGSWLYYLGVAGPTGWIYSWLKNWFFPPTDRVCGAGYGIRDM